MEINKISNNTQIEYLNTNIHSNCSNEMSTGADNLDLKIGKVKGKVYYVNLEFSDEQNNIGEEIRESLKKKFLQNKLGSMQMGASAIQSPTNDERSEL